MTEAPDRSHDLTKLHAEINQGLNQRFLLRSAAITVFSLGAEKLIPVSNDAPALVTAAGVATVYAALTFLLHDQSINSLHALHIASSYLREHCLSQWEHDWVKFADLVDETDQPLAADKSIAAKDNVNNELVYSILCYMIIVSSLYVEYLTYRHWTIELVPAATLALVATIWSIVTVRKVRRPSSMEAKIRRHYEDRWKLVKEAKEKLIAGSAAG